MQGFELSEKEKKYINRYHSTKFPTVIARELAVKYPKDNGGSRTGECIRRYIRVVIGGKK